MPRIGTPNLNLGTWLDNENPGAGSQTVDNTGLNGNWLKIDRAIGQEHNADGTHKTNIIGKSQLKTDVCDGVTIEKDTTQGLRLKDGGITGAKVNQTLFVDNATLEFASNAMRVKPGGITNVHIANNAILANHIAHDNNRTKLIVVCGIPTSAGTDYARIGDVNLSNSRGIVMPRAGSMTKLIVSNDSGVITQATAAYGVKTFAANSQITVYWYDGDAAVITKVVGGSFLLSTPNLSTTGLNFLVTMEFEFDN
jgi:hypothetical protein